MGGQLYLNNGKNPDRSNVCISGYQKGRENFALSNFEDNHGRGYDFNDPHMGVIHFPTSEHYLHFQKMTPSAKILHYAAWSQQSSPGAILAGIRKSSSPYYIKDTEHAYMVLNAKNKYEFNTIGWDKDKVDVQMQMNASKYQQSKDFKACIDMAISLGMAFGDGQGPATIIEDTSSANHLEAEWGTGPAGVGNNILGNSQTAFATMVQDKTIVLNASTPGFASFKNPGVENYYNRAKDQYTSDFQPTLMAIRKSSGFDNGVNQRDTADLGANFVQKTSLVNGHIQVKSYATSAPSSPPVNTEQENKESPSFVPAPRNTPATSTSGGEFYYSKGANQRLLIKNGEVKGYQYRSNASDSWNDGQKHYFVGLEDAFHMSTGKYYYSKGGNQRLLIKDGQVDGYQYRDNSLNNWKIGPAHKFHNLEVNFNTAQQHKETENAIKVSTSAVNDIKPFYTHASNAQSRFHMFGASSQQYRAFHGDLLKTKILSIFKEELQSCSSFIEFQNKVLEIKNRDEYRILAQGQGLITRGLGLETSSIKALNKMIEDIGRSLSESPKNQL